MKNILSTALLLILGIGLFTSCEDDRDSNPVLESPSTFVLNTPTYASTYVDMATTDSLYFTWSQPNYGGFPVAAEYQLQMSLTNSWTTEYDETAENPSGDFVTFSEYFKQCSGYISAAEMSKAIQQLGGFSKEEEPSQLTIYIRATCCVPGASSLSTSPTIYSNAVSMNTVPYYYELKDSPIEIWYLTGGCIADGSWSNSESAIGTGMIPMFPVEGNVYDKATGKGVIQYVGYFPADANFKIIAPEGLSNWNYGICGDGTDMGTSYRNGGDDPGNIWIANAGYYKIEVNTADCTCTITPYGSTPSVFDTMYITGGFDSWSVTLAMTPMETYSGAENHMWKYDLDTSASDTEVKFTIEGWGSNWGAEGFPYGTGVQNGSNIPATAGSYTVYFNDITGQYNFVSK